MSLTLTINPTLSPGSTRARKFSRFVAVLFALGFLVMLSVVLGAVACVFFPKMPSGAPNGIGLLNGIIVDFGSLTRRQAVGVIVRVELMTVPTVVVLHNMRKLFLCFARGEVFAARPIAHIRAASFWMTISFFTGIGGVYLLILCKEKGGLLTAVAHHLLGDLPAIALRFQDSLFVGVPTVIAAYVMEETRRIAADNAEIV